VHVEVLVAPQPPSEDDVRLGGGALPVALQPSAVGGRVDGVVRLIPGTGVPGELAHDHCLVVGMFPLGVEVAELVDPGERNVAVRVVHHRRALEVAYRQYLGLEVEGPPGQRAFGVVEVAIQRTGEHQRHIAR